MYQPPHFREESLEAQHELIRRHPLGLLVSAGPGGLMANPIPFLLDDGAAPLGVLRCHLSKANAQWRELEALEECLVVFQGPQAYVTPSWYATKQETGKVVPTWNYATVQVRARPQVMHDGGWIRRHVGDLTDMNEGRYPAPWAVEDAPESFVASQIKGIVGIELAITGIDGKWKMSQNRSAADRAGVAAGLSVQGGEDAAVGKMVTARSDEKETRQA